MVAHVNAATPSPTDAIRDYVSTTSAQDDTVASAQEAAEEFGLATPDAITAELLTFLAARAAGSAAVAGHTPTAIVMSPACGVLGLHIFRGFSDTGHVTCIEPEVQHQNLARQAFTDADVRSNMFRFLPSRPLDVVGRLAPESYDLAIADVVEEDLVAMCESTLPALRPGGVLVLLDSLLDGLIADTSRSDRQSQAAREADAALRALDGVRISRLPLGAGLTLITKVARA